MFRDFHLRQRMLDPSPDATRTCHAVRMDVGDFGGQCGLRARPGSKDQTHKVRAVHITHDDLAYTHVTVRTGHTPRSIDAWADRRHGETEEDIRAVLIRPDGYIAWADVDEQPLESALAHWFG